MLTMNFLDGHAPIEIAPRPVVYHADAGNGIGAYDTTDLHTGWGDRESDLLTGDKNVPRRIEMRPPTVYADWLAPVSPGEIEHVQEIVNRVWAQTSTVAGACESYRVIAQGIHDSYLPQPRPQPRPAKAKFKMINGRRAYIVAGCGWEAVTDIPCPVCLTGVVRWAEAGYVPGYRQCDSCGRQFLATVQAGLREAPGAGMSYLEAKGTK